MTTKRAMLKTGMSLIAVLALGGAILTFAKTTGAAGLSRPIEVPSALNRIPPQHNSFATVWTHKLTAKEQAIINRGGTVPGGYDVNEDEARAIARHNLAPAAWRAIVARNSGAHLIRTSAPMMMAGSGTGFGTAYVATFSHANNSIAVAAQVDAASNFNGMTQPFTASIWVAPTSSTGIQTLWSNGNIELYRIASTGGLYFRMFGASSNHSGNADANDAIEVHSYDNVLPTNSTPALVVVTFAGTGKAAGYKLYVNNSAVQLYNATLDSLSDSTASSSPWTMGAFAASENIPGCSFDGGMAGFRLYSRVLTQTEITNIYNAGAE